MTDDVIKIGDRRPARFRSRNDKMLPGVEMETVIDCEVVDANRMGHEGPSGWRTVRHPVRKPAKARLDKNKEAVLDDSMLTPRITGKSRIVLGQAAAKHIGSSSDVNLDGDAEPELVGTGHASLQQRNELAGALPNRLTVSPFLSHGHPETHRHNQLRVSNESKRLIRDRTQFQRTTSSTTLGEPSSKRFRSAYDDAGISGDNAPAEVASMVNLSHIPRRRRSQCRNNGSTILSEPLSKRVRNAHNGAESVSGDNVHGEVARVINRSPIPTRRRSQSRNIGPGFALASGRPWGSHIPAREPIVVDVDSPISANQQERIRQIAEDEMLARQVAEDERLARQLEQTLASEAASTSNFATTMGVDFLDTDVRQVPAREAIVVDLDSLVSEDHVNPYFLQEEERARQVAEDEMLARQLAEAEGLRLNNRHDQERRRRIASRLEFLMSGVQNASSSRGVHAHGYRRPLGGFHSRGHVLPTADRRVQFHSDMTVEARLDVLAALERAFQEPLQDHLSSALRLAQVDRDFNENDYEMLLALDENVRHNGASRSRIDQLPVFEIKEVKDSADECTVCLEVPAVGDTVRRLPCMHVFHKECIDTWLKRRPICPVCKAEL